MDYNDGKIKIDHKHISKAEKMRGDIEKNAVTTSFNTFASDKYMHKPDTDFQERSVRDMAPDDLAPYVQRKIQNITISLTALNRKLSLSGITDAEKVANLTAVRDQLITMLTMFHELEDAGQLMVLSARPELGNLIELRSLIVQQFITFPPRTPGWERDNAETDEFLASTICRMASVSSGSRLLSNIFDVQNGLITGFNAPAPSIHFAYSTRSTGRYHHPCAFPDDRSVNIQASVNANGKLISSGNYTSASVQPPCSEYFEAIHAANAAVHGGDIFDGLEVSLLGHELVHALHDVLGVNTQRYATNAAPNNDLNKATMGQLKTSDNVAHPLSTRGNTDEENITSGSLVDFDYFLTHPLEAGDFFVDAIAYDMSSEETKAAFEVSERTLREDVGVIEMSDYINKQSYSQVLAGHMTREEYVAYVISTKVFSLATSNARCASASKRWAEENNFPLTSVTMHSFVQSDTFKELYEVTERDSLQSLHSALYHGKLLDDDAQDLAEKNALLQCIGDHNEAIFNSIKPAVLKACVKQACLGNGIPYGA